MIERTQLNTEQQALVEDNLRLAGFMAQKFINNSPLELDDLMSLCYVGLCKAAGTFDPTKGFTFSTWAASCIRFVVLKDSRYYRRHNPDYMYLEDLLHDELTPWEQVLSNNQRSIDDVVADRVLIQQLSQVLNDKEKLVLHHMLADPTAQQRQIAKLTGITQPHVSRLMKRIEKKFKQQLVS